MTLDGMRGPRRKLVRRLERAKYVYVVGSGNEPDSFFFEKTDQTGRLMGKMLYLTRIKGEVYRITSKRPERRWY